MLTIKWIQYTLEIHQSLCCLDNQSIFRNVTSTWSSIALLLKHSFVAWEFNLLFVDPGAYLSYAWLSLWSLWEAPTLAGGKVVLVKQGANLPTVCGRGLGEGLAATSYLGSGCAGCSCVLVAVDLQCKRNVYGRCPRCLSLQIQLSKWGWGAMSSVPKHPLPDELLSGFSGTLVQEDSAMLCDAGRLWWFSSCPWATQALTATGNNSWLWKQ